MKKTKSILLLLAVGSALLVQSCKKKNDPAPTTPASSNSPSGPTGVTSKFYFQATINGTVVTYQDGVASHGAAAGDQSLTVPSGWQEVQSASIENPFAPQNSGGFYIAKTFAGLTASNPPTGTQIESLFGVRSYSYGKLSPSTADEGVDGAVVYYIDNNGVEWRSDLGAATQTGSTFSITEHIANSDGYSYRISKAVFSCKLYNASGGTMTLTNGFCRCRTVIY